VPPHALLEAGMQVSSLTVRIKIPILLYICR
jgi:hypothetical protein